MIPDFSCPSNRSRWHIASIYLAAFYGNDRGWRFQTAELSNQTEQLLILVINGSLSLECCDSNKSRLHVSDQRPQLYPHCPTLLPQGAKQGGTALGVPTVPPKRAPCTPPSYEQLLEVSLVLTCGNYGPLSTILSTSFFIGKCNH